MPQTLDDAIEAEVARMVRRNQRRLSILSPRQLEHLIEIYRETLRHHPVFSRLLEQVRDYEAPDVSGDNAKAGPASETTRKAQ